MLYLLTQIGISLLLAGIAGGAIGWLIQRHRSRQHIQALRRSLTQMQHQVTQAHADVAMISDDFNELKLHSQNEIDDLRLEVQKMPALHQNLEKSQLLVRQLMQKHEAQLRELTDENAGMQQQLKLVKDREATMNRLQAELAMERRRNQQRDGVAAADALREQTGSDDAQSTALEEDPTDTAPTTVDDATGDTLSLFGDGDDDSPLTDAKASQEAEAEEGKEAMEDTGSVMVDETAVASGNAELQLAELKADVEALAAELAEGAPSTGNEAAPITDSTTDSMNGQDGEIQPLFEPVEQHDDLKRIFGIGPVTEKTLNKLGITSYSQLAELKQHDIDKIADALQIFPGRIERDNWVGSARRQLEEVLEEL